LAEENFNNCWWALCGEGVLTEDLSPSGDLGAGEASLRRIELPGYLGGRKGIPCRRPGLGRGEERNHAVASRGYAAGYRCSLRDRFEQATRFSRARPAIPLPENMHGRRSITGA
jgi:hypothetical protein